jgi:alcohol dehydrogenase (cytochrome c)
MTLRRLVLVASFVMAPVLVVGQAQRGLDPASLLKPLADSWPTYSGDYTGRRYSSLTQINQTTVKGLTLAWVQRLTGRPPTAGGGFGGRGGGGSVLAGGTPTSNRESVSPVTFPIFIGHPRLRCLTHRVEVPA